DLAGGAGVDAPLQPGGELGHVAEDEGPVVQRAVVFEEPPGGAFRDGGEVAAAGDLEHAVEGEVGDAGDEVVDAQAGGGVEGVGSQASNESAASARALVMVRVPGELPGASVPEP